MKNELSKFVLFKPFLKKANTMKLQKYFLLFSFILLAHFGISQSGQLITIQESDPWNTTEIQDWVLNVLHGGGGELDTASIIFTGNPQQIGKFTRGESAIAVDSGIVISTGKVIDIQSFNILPNESFNFKGPSDADLDSIYSKDYGLAINPFPPPLQPYTGDAAVIEFEYTPYGEQILLRYVFGSEEYPYVVLPPVPPSDIDYTGLSAPYSLEEMFDIFAIHIDRPNSPYFVNLATTPPIAGEDDIVVNTVNLDVNSVFFQANPGGPDSYGHQFDGITKSMDALLIRRDVIPCVPYRVKIAIEEFLTLEKEGEPDSKGYHWDSGLFLGGGSLIGGADAPPWTSSYEWTHPNSGFEGQLIEGGCNELLVTFKLGYPTASTNPYYIPFRVESSINRDKLLITYDDTGEVLPIDSITFNFGETEKIVRISAVNLTTDIPNVKFTYPSTPCERPHPPISGGQFTGVIPFTLVNNEPFTFTANPKVYSAFCKETIELTVTDITEGGVDPIIYVWPGNPVPPVDIYDHTVNNSPDYVTVGVKDLCGKDTSVVIRINNKPIVLDQIQQIFLCGPGQSATVPVDVIVPDQPGYSIEHVKWWKQGFPTPPLGDEDGDEITVEYDLVVGDDIWTCEYDVVDICGGEADGSFEINQSSLVLNNDGICSGDDIVLFTGTPANWYEWYREEPDNSLTLVGTTQSTTDSNYPSGQNEIRYKLKIEDNCGELQEAWMTIYVDIYEPEITLSPGDEICYGATISLTVNEGATEYFWTQTGETTTSITLDETEYQVGLNQYTVETVSESAFFYCLNSATIEFTVYENPEAGFTIEPADHPCTNTDISFDYLHSDLNRTFVWDFGDGSPTSSNPYTTHQYANAGTYTVNLFVEHEYASGYRCSSDSTATVIVDPLPVAAFSPSPIEGCEPLDVTFTDNSIDVFPNATYDWSFGDGNSYSGLPGAVSHTYDSAGSYTVGLTVTNTERCFGSTSYSSIQVNPNPDADFIADPWVTTMDDPEIEFFNESDSDDLLELFEWDFDDNDGSSDENPVHTYIEPGLYNVYFRIETEKGCWDTIVKQVELSLYVKMYIPNAFSPNGDGLNDKFEIKGTPITDFNLYIYDRWGKQIWSTHNWENQWDGTDASGNIVPVGTYIYKIAGTSPDPDANYELGAVTYQGTVTVTK